MTVTPLNTASILAFGVGDSSYTMRRFDLAKDLDALTDTCSNVYGGRDYLPRTAASLVADPRSSFFVLADSESDRPASVANARKFKPKMAWLEAVRTCDEHRNKGLARRLTQSLIDLSRDEGHEVYTCTVESNVAMQKVFEKVGMRKLTQIHQCSFAILSDVPGWGAGDERSPQPFLKAFDAEHCVGESARSMEWLAIDSEEELNVVLNQVKKAGGIGHLVGLYELLANEVVEESLRDGLVWKLKSENDAAVFCLTREEKITSLKSKWVCSIAATSAKCVESALWEACSERCLSLLGGDVAFTLAFDSAVPIEGGPGTLVDVLPLVDDACLLFGTSSEEFSL